MPEAATATQETQTSQQQQKTEAVKPRQTAADRFRQAAAASTPTNGETAQPVTKAAPEAKPPEKKEAAQITAKPAAAKSALDAALTPAEVKPDTPTDWKPEASTDEIFKDEKPTPDHWKRSRAGMEQRDTRIGELQKQIGELQTKAEASGKPSPELQAALDALKRENEDYKGKLAQYDDSLKALNIELHPDFRREFIDGRKELVATACNKLKAYGGNPESLTDALALPEGRKRDEAIEETLGDLSESAKAKILRAVADVEALDEKRAKIMAKPQTGYEELERKTAAQRQKQAEEAQRVTQSEYDRITRELAAKIKTLNTVDPTLSDGKEWNDSLNRSREKGLALFSPDAPFDELAAVAFKGTHYDYIVPKLTGELQAARKEIAEKDARLAQYEKSEPNFQGRKPSGSATGEKLTPWQKYKAAEQAAEVGDDD